MNRKWLLMSLAIYGAIASGNSVEYLVKLKNTTPNAVDSFADRFDGSVEQVSQTGRLYKLTTQSEVDVRANLRNDSNVEYVQLNHPIRLFENPSLAAKREALLKRLEDGEFGGLPFFGKKPEDNPEIKTPGAETKGADPLLSKAWGLSNSVASAAWENTPGGEGIIVAVTDTGVDYNHEDLIHNMWRNPKEVPGDNIDNDKNGYVDDIVGWDFAAKDNKPFDLTLSLFEIILMGGNAGHGTHCAGVIGARANNKKGARGVAPNVKLMALRFITEKGQGDTASAVQAVDYAVKNGAQIISASWGSQGEEEGDKALREAIQRAQDAGVLFVAAAGNGRVDMKAGKAVGYNNDTDPKPSYPASYPHENIISVAAIDIEEKLAEFSNFGKKTVDVGAPGVKVLSTVPGNKYQDTVIELGEIMKATWDGTSMATPHVAGALANIWSRDRENLRWDNVKNSLLTNAVAITALKDKVSSNGRLDLSFLRN